MPSRSRIERAILSVNVLLIGCILVEQSLKLNFESRAERSAATAAPFALCWCGLLAGSAPRRHRNGSRVRHVATLMAPQLARTIPGFRSTASSARRGHTYPRYNSHRRGAVLRRSDRGPWPWRFRAVTCIACATTSGSQRLRYRMACGCCRQLWSWTWSRDSGAAKCARQGRPLNQVGGKIGSCSNMAFRA